MRYTRRGRATSCAATVLLLAAAIFLASCQRRASAAAGPTGAEKQAAPPAAPPPTAAAGAAAASALPKPAPEAEARATAAPRAAATPAAAAAPAAPADAGLHGLLGQGARDGILPEDFAIGPLAAERLLADDGRAAAAAAAALLDAFVSGRVDRTAIAVDARDGLAGMISFALERGDRPLSWRLGPPRADGAEQVANLRLFGAEGSAEGEIYARREGDGVLVSDLQIDPARMRVRRARPDRTFFPSPYRWLLGG